jgi:lipoate-protein ligase A
MPTGPSLVLGSTQSGTLVDPTKLAEASVGLVHRRSGGGAVLVVPDGQAWIEVWVPRHDRLWDDDVLRASEWLGEVWASALSSLGVADVSVHRGRTVTSPWSDTVCFAGVGPGEVAVAGRKVVGLSQHRTRRGARLYTMAPLWWDPEPLVRLLALHAGQRAEVRSGTAEAATGLADIVPGGGRVALLRAVEQSVLDHLPDGE